MVYFLKLNMCVYLRVKFEVSGLILTIFRQGLILLPHPPPQNKILKLQLRLGSIWKKLFSMGANFY